MTNYSINMKTILIIVTCFLITYSTCQESNGNSSNNGSHTASGNTHTYPLNMTKQSFIFFIVGTTISVFALIATLCLYRSRRRRRAISPYSTLTRDGKIDPRTVNEKGITMAPARDLLFPTQSHNRATYNSKDADIPTWDRKTQVERHNSVRLPKTVVKKWGNERESNRNSKTKQWLDSLEQQRDQRKQWLDGIEQKREARKSWIVNISPRSTDVSVLPSSPTTREQRRSKLLSSLKQRETNPDADNGEVKETLRNSNRKSWNPELARRESGKSLTRSQRKSYRASMIEGDKRLERDINGGGNEENKGIQLERERAYVAQPTKKQTLFGEGGAMWETVLERV